MLRLSSHVKEVPALRNRIQRQFGMGRITREQFDHLTEKMDELCKLLDEYGGTDSNATDEEKDPQADVATDDSS